MSSASKHPISLYTAPSKIHGSGVYCYKKISNGVCIGEYTGELISDSEANARLPETECCFVGHTLQFDLSSGNVIDGSVDGGILNYVNHSKKPNCEAVEEDQRIFFYTLKLIPERVELTINYKCRCGCNV